MIDRKAALDRFLEAALAQVDREAAIDFPEGVARSLAVSAGLARELAEKLREIGNRLPESKFRQIFDLAVPAPSPDPESCEELRAVRNADGTWNVTLRDRFVGVIQPAPVGVYYRCVCGRGAFGVRPSVAEALEVIGQFLGASN